MSEFYGSTLYSLMTPDVGVGVKSERPGNGDRRSPVLYGAAKRSIERQDAREYEDGLRYGFVSWVFAVKDGSRWRAGVMLNERPGRFRRILSVALFTTDAEAMDAARRTLARLEQHKR